MMPLHGGSPVSCTCDFSPFNTPRRGLFCDNLPSAVIEPWLRSPSTLPRSSPSSSSPLHGGSTRHSAASLSSNPSQHRSVASAVRASANTSANSDTPPSVQAGAEFVWGHERQVFMNEPGRAYRKWKSELGLTYRIKAAFGVRPLSGLVLLRATPSINPRLGERRGQYSFDEPSRLVLLIDILHFSVGSSC